MNTQQLKKTSLQQAQEKLVRAIAEDYVRETGDSKPDLKKLQNYIQKKGGEKYIQKKQQELVKKALHGIKLNYIRSISNKCAEDEELVYYKKGGSIGCGCKKKMETGGPVKKGNTVAKFKNDYSSKRVKDSEEDYLNGFSDHETYKSLKKLNLPEKKVQTSGTINKNKLLEKKVDLNKIKKPKIEKGEKLKKAQNGTYVDVPDWLKNDASVMLTPHFLDKLVAESKGLNWNKTNLKAFAPFSKKGCKLKK